MQCTLFKTYRRPCNLLGCGAMHNVHIECFSIILYAFILRKENNKPELTCRAVIENHPPYTIIMTQSVQYMKLAYNLY
jgi:hypothetical protein